MVLSSAESTIFFYSKDCICEIFCYTYFKYAWKYVQMSSHVSVWNSFAREKLLLRLSIYSYCYLEMKKVSL